jgi:hypothetical protein
MNEKQIEKAIGILDAKKQVVIKTNENAYKSKSNFISVIFKKKSKDRYERWIEVTGQPGNGQKHNYALSLDEVKALMKKIETKGIVGEATNKDLTNNVYVVEFSQYGKTKRVEVRTDSETSAKNLIHGSRGIELKDIKIIKNTTADGYLAKGIYDIKSMHESTDEEEYNKAANMKDAKYTNSKTGDYAVGDTVTVKWMGEKVKGKVIEHTPESVAGNNQYRHTYFVKLNGEPKPQRFYQNAFLKESKETSRKGTYTDRKIQVPDFKEQVLIGNISGWNGYGIPVYDLHKIGLHGRKDEKVGELQATFIKKYLKAPMQESNQLTESTLQVEKNGKPIGWDKVVGYFWGKTENGKYSVTTDKRKIDIIKKELEKKYPSKKLGESNIMKKSELTKLIKESYKEVLKEATIQGDTEPWEGTDRDLEISLMEYNFVAKQPKSRDYPDEWFVLYKINDNAFGTGWIREKELQEIVNGNEWASKEDVDSFLDYLGSDVKHFARESFTNKLSDVLSYWGYQNIMGSDYSPINKKEAFDMVGIDNDIDEDDEELDENKTIKKSDLIHMIKESYKEVLNEMLPDDFDADEDFSDDIDDTKFKPTKSSKAIELVKTKIDTLKKEISAAFAKYKSKEMESADYVKLYKEKNAQKIKLEKELLSMV